MQLIARKWQRRRDSNSLLRFQRPLRILCSTQLIGTPSRNRTQHDKVWNLVCAQHPRYCLAESGELESHSRWQAICLAGSPSTPAGSLSMFGPPARIRTETSRFKRPVCSRYTTRELFGRSAGNRTLFRRLRANCIAIYASDLLSGADGRDRTSDAEFFRLALYQLSYISEIWHPRKDSNPDRSG